MPIDTTTFHLGPAPDEDLELEGPPLALLEADARAFIGSHKWAPPIKEILLAYGVGPIVGLFLVRFETPIVSEGGIKDDELWVAVGDLPSIYFVTDDAETPKEAMEAYCGLAEDWADAVLEGGDLSACFPVAAAPTEEHARMLKGRLEFIREEIMPLAP